MVGEPPDREERERIVRELDASVLVEAGAGSGKTTSLVDRMLALIGEGRGTVERMAAVTFTRKAAAELKGRFQVGLEQAVRSEADPERKARFGRALASLERLFAGTIHAFCARLLRERPVEAGLDPDFTELEEDEDQALREACWSEYLSTLHLEGAPVLERVLDLGLDPFALQGAYEAVALFPEVEAVREEVEEPDLGDVREKLEAYLDLVRKDLPEEPPPGGWCPLQSVLRSALLRVRHLDWGHNPSLVQVLQGLESRAHVTLNRWPDPETARGQQAAFEGFRDGVVARALDAWRRYCHAPILDLVVPAVEHYRKRREEASTLNYNDLLSRAAALVRENPEVRGYFQRRFTHLLVDEFQDTDPIQAEMILLLAGEGVEETSWRKVRVRPGALFVVGDPKQSIYRFRRADIDTYNEVKGVLERSGGTVLALTANFRSLPPVCDWANRVFQGAFPPESTDVQAAFERLDPYREAREGGVRRILLPRVYGHSQQEIVRQDAARIADFIARAVEGGYPVHRSPSERRAGLAPQAGPGDFLILLRYKAHLAAYGRALEARGIPFQVTGGGAFGESEEVGHLVSLLKAVSEPEDRISLVATLRGPFFGISDDRLYRYRRGGGVFSLFAEPEGCADAEAAGAVCEAFAALRTYRAWARTRPPAAALSRIVDHLGILPLAATRENGETRAGNLLKALEMGFRDGEKGASSFPELVDRLAGYVEAPDVESMSLEPGKKQAVRIMNLHKAKGLEAPVVFLADPVKEVSHPPDRHIDRTGDRARGFFVVSRKKGDFGSEVLGLPSDWDRLEKREARYREAEEMRLLYVAATRARQLLVVSQYPAKPDQGAWRAFNPHLQEAPELEEGEGAQQPVPLKLDGPRESFSGGARIREERFSMAMTPSYATEAVTDVAKGEAAHPVRAGRGKGMAWGRIVHRMLELLIRAPSLDVGAMAGRLVREEDMPRSGVEDVVACVERVRGSELWKRIEGAEAVLSEVPFSITREGEDLPRTKSGTLDVAFREGDGWVLADYKTDAVDGNLDALVEHYRSQVETYRACWEEIAGEAVKEAGLYFVGPGEWLTI